MVKIPEFDTPETPEDSNILKISNKRIFLISFLIEIINLLLSTFGLNFLNVNNYIKVICFLACTCVILFIVIVLLYVKDREHYFKEVFLNNMYRLLCNQFSNLQNQTDKISKQIKNK